ncbi:MFS transporter [Streptomyces sp. Amel2xB2]|nr:MFS transporter [Streptomyces sp. Amel2xB2]
MVRVLRDRDAGLYLGGVTASAFGDSAMALAAGVWVKTLTGSDGLAALVTFCFWLPAPAGPALGVLADRVRLRPLLAGTSLTLAAVLLLPLAVHSRQQVWLLFVVLVLVGTGAVLTDAAGLALGAALVPASLRGDLNGMARTAVESAKLLAPAVGAGLFTAFGGHAVALLDSLTFVLAAAAFTLLRTRGTGGGGSRVGTGGGAAPGRADGRSSADVNVPRARRSWAAETAEGVRFVWHRRPLRALVLAGGAALAASGLSSTATYALVDSGLHRSPTFAAVLTTAQGAGSMAAGLTAGALLRRMPEHRLAAAGLALFAAGSLARAAPWPSVVTAGSLLIGAGLPLPLLAALTAVQRETPGSLLGRAAATAHTLMFAPTGVALLVGTATVSLIDHRVQVLAAGVLAACAGAALLLTAARRTRHHDPQDHERQPDAAGPYSDPEQEPDAEAPPDTHPDPGTEGRAEPRVRD